MRKAIIIIIALILMLGASGCGSVPAAQHKLSRADITNAWNIALAINAYNALNPSNPILFAETLEDVKERYIEYVWPAGLSYEEEKAAWELIVYKDDIAYLTPEAQQALREEPRDESDEVKIANASTIAAGINAYNALYPGDTLPDNATLAEVKEALDDYLWPSFLTKVEARRAWELIVIKGGVAKVNESDPALEK